MDRPHSLTEALNVFQIRDTVRLSGICGSNIVAIGENLRQSHLSRTLEKATMTLRFNISNQNGGHCVNFLTWLLETVL